MKKVLRALTSVALLAGLTLFAPQAANAEDIFGPFPACPNFDVSLSFTGGNQGLRVTRLHDGVFYTVTAGSGTIITFYAVDRQTGALLRSVTVDTKASVTKTAEIGDVTKYSIKGYGTLLLFPTDADGPSTTVYNGNVTFTLKTATGDQVGPVVSSGRQFDICAALS
ncbi:hypothetical protein [Arthrobacter celericrescens]|uniref:hypothetical protein n=1 Tax=Arthrobacter celericrescens TaxID=2320851 RepID=UPI000EA27117|nr:hypothetical protein [Arthrobacter celericrescens]